MIRLRTIKNEQIRELSFAKAALKKTEQEVLEVEEAISLANKCLEECSSLSTQISKTSSEIVSDVLGRPCKIRFTPVDTSEGPNQGIKLESSLDNEEFLSINQEGDGINSILHVFLKIAFQLLSRKTAKIIILDEPLGAHLSDHLWHRVQAFLERIVEKTGLQVIIVTHTSMPFGAIYEVDRNKGISTVTKREETNEDS